MRKMGYPSCDFNPRPPRGGRPRGCPGTWGSKEFQSTPPARGATVLRFTFYGVCGNFNPRPPRGGRQDCPARIIDIDKFQSTPPARGATLTGKSFTTEKLISIHAPREGGDVELRPHFAGHNYFNPRPPRGGRLWRARGQLSEPRDFNPRPPRGGRPLTRKELAIARKFQSTPPARGATCGGNVPP